MSSESPIAHSKPQRCLLLVASQQVMHHLEAIQCWLDVDSDCQLFIYHTDDISRSVAPAQRIKHFVEKHFAKRIPCQMLSGDSSPQALLQCWKQLSNSIDPDVQWIINASGGTKPMAAALMNLAEKENVQIYYREITSGWCRVHKVDDDISTEPARLTCNLSFDQFTIDDLIALQIPIQPGQQLSSLEIPNIDPLRVVQQGCACNWNWVETFDRCGYDSSSSGGLMFETLIGAAIRQFGISNVRTGLKLTGNDGNVLYEVDVVAIVENQVLLFDCKLRSDIEGNWIEQIQLAEERRRWLGGLNSRTMLVRPNAKPTEDHMALARAYNISVLGPRESFRLFSELGQFLDLPLPQPLAEAEAILQQSSNVSLSPFSTDGRVYRRRPKWTPGESLISLQSVFKQLRELRKQDWAGYQLDTLLYLRLPKQAFGTADTRQKSIENFKLQLEHFGKVKKSTTETNCIVEIQRPVQKTVGLQFVQLLEYLDQHPQAADLVNELTSYITSLKSKAPTTDENNI